MSHRSPLEYPRRSGSVGRAQEFLASLVDIKSIFAIGGGVTEAVDKVPTRRRTLEGQVELVEEPVGRDGSILVDIGHANVPDELAWFRAKVRERRSCHRLLVIDFGMTTSAPADPAVLAMTAYGL